MIPDASVTLGDRVLVRIGGIPEAPDVRPGVVTGVHVDGTIDVTVFLRGGYYEGPLVWESLDGKPVSFIRTNDLLAYGLNLPPDAWVGQ